MEQSCRGEGRAVPVYAEDTLKGDRFIKDRQHVHLIHNGVQLVPAAGRRGNRGKVINIHKAGINKTRCFIADDC